MGEVFACVDILTFTMYVFVTI